MASQFQNRLVGISILVASVVIFLPSIIDGKKEVYEDEFIATPIRPDTQEHTQQLEITNVETITETTQVETVAPAEQIEEDEDWQVQQVTNTVTIENKTTFAEKQEKEEPVIVASSKTVDKALTKTVVTKKSAPENAWTIQLGAFQNATNINALLKKLHKAGFQAHTIPEEVIDGELTRLFVGPDVSKEKLEKQLPRLKRLTKLEGKLLPFNAVNP